MAELLESKEKIIKVVCEKSGKSKKEVEELIEKKKEKFSGLLTDSGAAFIVAKELGVKLNVAEGMSERLKISQLDEGMNNIELLVRVYRVYSPRKFEKEGKKGMLCNLLVGDDSGALRLTVWHNEVKKLEEEGIKRNSILLLKNCYVSAFNKVLQLNLGYNGEIILRKEKEVGKEVPAEKDYSKKLDELKAGMDEVDVTARVLRIFPERAFSTGEREGKLINFSLGDGTAIVRATAWNELTEEVGKLSPGEIVRAEGAYTKEGLKGNIELHLGWKARVFKNPSAKIPALNELLKKEVKHSSIEKLNEGDRDVEVKATVIALNKSSLLFNVCPQCGGKIQREGEGFLCGKCGEVKEPEKRMVLSFELDDGSGIIKGIAFGLMAEKILGVNAMEAGKMLEEKSAEEVLDGLKEGIQGKVITGDGNVRMNPMSNEKELILNNISEITFIEEK
ncbi:MAG: OB-fold nucleic acid binding domain-containing protein [archaeon]